MIFFTEAALFIFRGKKKKKKKKAEEGH